MVNPGETALFPGAETLKALTLKRPWPTVILFGPKRVENRTWEMPMRREGIVLALHSGQGYDREGDAAIRERWPAGRNSRFLEPEAGLLFAVARLSPTRGPEEFKDDVEQAVWAFGPYCYRITEMVNTSKLRLVSTGALGLWSVEPVVAAQLLKAWREGRAAK